MWKWVSCKKAISALMLRRLEMVCECFSDMFRPLVFKEIILRFRLLLMILGGVMVIKKWSMSVSCVGGKQEMTNVG